LTLAIFIQFQCATKLSSTCISFCDWGKCNTCCPWKKSSKIFHVSILDVLRIKNETSSKLSFVGNTHKLRKIKLGFLMRVLMPYVVRSSWVSWKKHCINFKVMIFVASIICDNHFEVKFKYFCKNFRKIIKMWGIKTSQSN